MEKKCKMLGLKKEDQQNSAKSRVEDTMVTVCDELGMADVLCYICGKESMEHGPNTRRGQNRRGLSLVVP